MDQIITRQFTTQLKREHSLTHRNSVTEMFSEQARADPWKAAQCDRTPLPYTPKMILKEEEKVWSSIKMFSVGNVSVPRRIKCVCFVLTSHLIFPPNLHLYTITHSFLGHLRKLMPELLSSHCCNIQAGKMKQEVETEELFQVIHLDSN